MLYSSRHARPSGARIACRFWRLTTDYRLLTEDGAISQRRQTRGASAKRKPSLRQMEPEVVQAAAALDLQFARWDLLREALIHRSYLNEDASATESNERLEFLGDAALGFIVARYLFDRFKDAPEGQLTRRRMALVSNQTLARWARRIGLDRMLLISKGERGIELPDRVLGGAFEALLAAILLDRGSAAVEAFLVPILDAEADELVARTMAGNFKGRLQEIVQERERITPTYQTLDTPEADHERRFTVAVMLDDRVLATGQGKSKQIAEQAAAEAGLAAYIAQERAAADEGTSNE